MTQSLVGVTRSENSGIAVTGQNEWIKAAYYSPSLTDNNTNYYYYPTQSNTEPNPITEGNINEKGDVDVSSLDKTILSENGYSTYDSQVLWSTAPSVITEPVVDGDITLHLEGNFTDVGGTTSLSPWGSFDMGGNVVEIIDTLATPPKLFYDLTPYKAYTEYYYAHGGITAASDYQLWITATGVANPMGQIAGSGYRYAGFRLVDLDIESNAGDEVGYSTISQSETDTSTSYQGVVEAVQPTGDSDSISLLLPSGFPYEAIAMKDSYAFVSSTDDDGVPVILAIDTASNSSFLATAYTSFWVENSRQYIIPLYYTPSENSGIQSDRGTFDIISMSSDGTSMLATTNQALLQDDASTLRLLVLKTYSGEIDETVVYPLDPNTELIDIHYFKDENTFISLEKTEEGYDVYFVSTNEADDVTEIENISSDSVQSVTKDLLIQADLDLKEVDSIRIENPTTDEYSIFLGGVNFNNAPDEVEYSLKKKDDGEWSSNMISDRIGIADFLEMALEQGFNEDDVLELLGEVGDAVVSNMAEDEYTAKKQALMNSGVLDKYDAKTQEQFRNAINTIETYHTETTTLDLEESGEGTLYSLYDDNVEYFYVSTDLSYLTDTVLTTDPFAMRYDNPQTMEGVYESETSKAVTYDPVFTDAMIYLRDAYDDGVYANGDIRLDFSLVDATDNSSIYIIPFTPPTDGVSTEDEGSMYNEVGNVDYPYYISRYETTAAQYVAFLNTVDPEGNNPIIPGSLLVDPENKELYEVRLYDSRMGEEPRYGQIMFNEENPDGEKYTLTDPAWANKPVANLNVFQAFAYVNSVHNGTSEFTPEFGLEEVGDYEILMKSQRIRLGENYLTGQYNLIQNLEGVTRSENNGIAVTGQNEWIKAAYYSPSLTDNNTNYYYYPTQSNTEPNPITEDNINEKGDVDVSSLDTTILSENGYSTYDSQALWSTAPSVITEPVVDGDITLHLEGNFTDVGGTTSLSPWGSFDMGGNVVEIIDTLAMPPKLFYDLTPYKAYSEYYYAHGGITAASDYQLWITATGVVNPMGQVEGSGYRYGGFRLVDLDIEINVGDDEEYSTIYQSETGTSTSYQGVVEAVQSTVDSDSISLLLPSGFPYEAIAMKDSYAFVSSTDDDGVPVILAIDTASNSSFLATAYTSFWVENSRQYIIPLYYTPSENSGIQSDRGTFDIISMSSDGTSMLATTNQALLQDDASTLRLLVLKTYSGEIDETVVYPLDPNTELIDIHYFKDENTFISLEKTEEGYDVYFVSTNEADDVTEIENISSDSVQSVTKDLLIQADLDLKEVDSIRIENSITDGYLIFLWGVNFNNATDEFEYNLKKKDDGEWSATLLSDRVVNDAELFLFYQEIMLWRIC